MGHDRAFEKYAKSGSYYEKNVNPAKSYYGKNVDPDLTLEKILDPDPTLDNMRIRVIPW